MRFAVKYFYRQTEMLTQFNNPHLAERMCQYFWFNCEICSLRQDYALYCQVGLSHSPCKSYIQPAVLPLITPPPICQCCGHARGTKPFVYTLPSRARSARRDEILPELQAILNNSLFWTDPALRLPNNMEITAKYNAAREKIFEDAEEERKHLSAKGVDDQQQGGQVHEVLEVAWKQVRNAIIDPDRAIDVSQVNVADDAERKLTSTL